MEGLYGGTRRAAQEIEGKVVEAEGALFTAEMLARARNGAVPETCELQLLPQAGVIRQLHGTAGREDSSANFLLVLLALPSPG